ncbi:unnamed protein product [Tilletia controversa]|nr:hypothetical protein CF336_g509 [Tilletia laevis]CAD6884835.1 unnamed protein product [Tilletia caries]CAD6905847.1 unnamed protein product [Tilletia controversa]KAE8207817.1 hypothetical protein CF335_g864 [Tilletia laevis]CAD6907476.1 unnamed protein product [Tilletia controversa]
MSSIALPQDSTAVEAAASARAESSTLAAESAHVVRPDAHTQRFDRQLRLWASSGQRSLESASILLLGATALGAQILKNLVLPGIGRFTILDANLVTPEDLASNFFLEPDVLGKSRGAEVVKCLLELNPNVKGEAVVSHPAHVLAGDASYFTSTQNNFSLIIAANQPASVVMPLADLCASAKDGFGIPLMIVRSSGMVGEIKLQVKEHPVIETHPASLVDLRLTAPFAELEAYADSANLQTTDTMEFAHVPFVVLLLRKLKEWREAHGGSLPVSSDRRAFLDSVNALRRQAGDADQENIDEAVSALTQHIWGPLGRPSISTKIQALLEDPKSTGIDKQSSNFWLLIRSLKSFVEAPAPAPTPSSQQSSETSALPGGGGLLPLPGSLPDMKASSAGYVELQNVYRRKALQDLANFQAHLSSILASVGLAADVVPLEEVESFVKHAAYVELIRGRTERESREDPAKSVFAQAFEDPINPISMPHHIAFLAADRFYGLHSRWPGSDSIFSAIVSSSGVLLSDDPANGPGFVNPSQAPHGSYASKGPAASASSMIAQSEGGSGSPSHPTAGPAAGDTESMLYEDDRRTFKRARAMESSSSSDTPNGTASRDVIMTDAAAGDGAKANGRADPDAAVNFEQDVAALCEEARAVCRHVGLLDGEDGAWEEGHWERVEQACEEMTRAGRADLPSTAALLGGVAAQEVIKLVTRQYIPLDNLCVYDGIKGAMGAYRV